MVRQKRPRGPLWTVDDDWKRDVLAAMVSKGISRADLARRIGVAPAAMTVLFRPTTKQSRLVPAIHRELGMVETTSAVSAIERDDAFKRLQRIWKALSEKEREHLISTGELLAAKR